MALPHQYAYFYGDDDVTVLFSCSTNPAHASPWVGAAALKRAPLTGLSSEPNVREGTSRIGTQAIEVTDNYIDPLNQRTGWLTAELYNAGGKTRLLSRRLRFLEDDPLGGPQLVRFDGIIEDIILQPQRTTYLVALRDIRERERRMRAFVRNEGFGIFPRGIVGGYGKTFIAEPDDAPLNLLGSIFPRPEAIPYHGTYAVDPVSAWAGRVLIDNPTTIVHTADEWDWRLSFGFPSTMFDPATGASSRRYRDAVLWWRIEASGAAWKVLRRMRVPPASTLASYGNVFLVTRDDETRGYKTPKAIVLSEPEDLLAGWQPANGARVELFLTSGKEPTEDAPLYKEWRTHGHLLESLWNGEESDPEVDLTVRFDQASIDELKTEDGAGPARIKRSEVIEDLREWVGPNILKPCGRFPYINDQGRVALARTRLPDSTTPLVVLNDDNCTFAGQRWSHGAKSIITKSEFHYNADIIPSHGIEVVEGATGPVHPMDAVIEKPIKEEKINIAGAAVHGRKAIVYKPETFRGVSGGGIFGPTTPIDEFRDIYATWRAQERNLETVDRYYEGTPDYELRASMDDPAVFAAREGDWATVEIDSFPDTLSDLRGSNRLAQIIGRTLESPRVVRFRLSDVGPLLAPLGVPTIDTIADDEATSTVSVRVSAIPAGAEVEVQYARVPAGDPVPPANSALWRPFGRTNVVNAIVRTPPIVQGGRIWVRAIAKNVGRISSAPTAALNATLDERLGFYGSNVTIDAAGAPVVVWAVPAAVAGVRVKYWEHAIDVAPPVDTNTWNILDRAGADGGETLPITVKQGRQVTVQLQAFAGFGGGAVSGTAGDIVRVSAARDDRTRVVMPVIKEQPQESTTIGTLLLAVTDPQARITKVSFATATGNSQLGAYVEDSSLPYSYDVPLVDKQPSRIAYRVEGVKADGSVGVIHENVVSFAAQLTPVATVSVTNESATAAAATFDFAYGSATSYIEAYFQDFAADPGNVSVEFSGTRAPNMPFHRDDGRSSVVAPSNGASRWVAVTLIPYDSINKRGTPVNERIQAAAAPPAVPSDIPDLDLVAGSETLSTAELDVTMPASIANLDKIRIYSTGGALLGEFTRTAAANAVQRVQLTGLASGTAYAVRAKGRSNGGLESTNFSATVNFTTDAGGQLATPIAVDAEHLGAQVLVTWGSPGGYPPGVVYEVYFARTSDSSGDPGFGSSTLSDETTGTSMMVPWPIGSDDTHRMWTWVVATLPSDPSYTDSNPGGPASADYEDEL